METNNSVYVFMVTPLCLNTHVLFLFMLLTPTPLLLFTTDSFTQIHELQYMFMCDSLW